MKNLIKFRYFQIKQAIWLLRSVKNPISSFLYYINRKDHVTVKTRKIGSFSFDSTQHDLCHTLLAILPKLENSNYEQCSHFYSQASNKNSIIELNDYKFVYDGCSAFAEIFAEYPYNFKSSPKDNIIIDIGANVGDTALEFANEGYVVYGFEPVKHLYEVSQKNLELNPNLKDKIHLFNYAVSYKRGHITIDSLDSTSYFIDSVDSYEVEVITLDDIITNYNIKPTLLKIDCEGCEFEIIENSDLSIFNEIIMEQHAGYVNKNYLSLIDALKKQGFDIELHTTRSYSADFVGIIHAYKK